MYVSMHINIVSILLCSFSVSRSSTCVLSSARPGSLSGPPFAPQKAPPPFPIPFPASRPSRGWQQLHESAIPPLLDQAELPDQHSCSWQALARGVGGGLQHQSTSRRTCSRVSPFDGLPQALTTLPDCQQHRLDVPLSQARHAHIFRQLQHSDETTPLMQVDAPFDVDKLQKQYPATYQESMNTVLVQEALRYNALLEVVAASLQECARAVKGLVVMSPSLEAVANSMYDNQVRLTELALPCMCCVSWLLSPTKT